MLITNQFAESQSTFDRNNNLFALFWTIPGYNKFFSRKQFDMMTHAIPHDDYDYSLYAAVPLCRWMMMMSLDLNLASGVASLACQSMQYGTWNSRQQCQSVTETIETNDK